MEINTERYTKAELCKIYTELNHHKWCCLLGDKPEWWDSMTKYKKKSKKTILIRRIMGRIEDEVGQKELLEYHWLINLGRTKEEFGEWYDARVSNHVFGLFNEKSFDQRNNIFPKRFG